MALGYEVGAILKRRGREWSDDLLTIKVDWIESLDRAYVQFNQISRRRGEAGEKLGLELRTFQQFYRASANGKLTLELREQMTEEIKHKFSGLLSINRPNGTAGVRHRSEHRAASHGKQRFFQSEFSALWKFKNARRWER